MRDISITVTNLVLVLIAVPLGAGLGVFAARAARGLVTPISDNSLALVGALAVAGVLAYSAARAALPTVRTTSPPGQSGSVAPSS